MTARLAVRVHPGARRDAIRGRMADGTLKVEVSAPPEDGRANQAVCALIAAALGIRRQQVVVVHGQASRAKQVEITGLEPDTIAARIEAAIASGNPREQRGQ